MGCQAATPIAQCLHPACTQDACKYDVLNRKSYTELYKDLRTAVDMCHRDGSLKRAVANNPDKFIHRDEHLIQVGGLVGGREVGGICCLGENGGGLCHAARGLACVGARRRRLTAATADGAR